MLRTVDRTSPVGVGIIGAGPGVAALHLPTLDRLPALFEVVHIADAGSGRAEALATPIGARASTGTEDLLADPRVEVVAICSPPHEHVQQILDAVAAGKRGVFCEKPLALTAADAELAIAACHRAGVALLVGTNHLYDPAWNRAKHHLVSIEDRVRTVSVTLSLPPNERYHAQVMHSLEETRPVSAVTRPAPDWADPAVAASIVRQLILGLGVHDLPLVRDLAPTVDSVIYARPLPPLGYCVGYLSGDVLVRLSAVMLPDGADALWRLSIGTDRDQLDVAFPPAFVHAGSAEVSVRRDDGRTISYGKREEDGYLSEWRAFAELVDGCTSVEYGELLADAQYAIHLADLAAEKVRAALGSAAGVRHD